MSRLASKFGTFTSDEIDSLEMEFRDFRASLDADLPEYDPQISSGVDRFWSAMAEVRSVTDSGTFRYSVLSKLANILLILQHSNADPERMFSMVRKKLIKESSWIHLLCVIYSV